jgi:hypothetical protein
MPPRHSSKKDSPKKLAGLMKRRWRVVLLRNNGEILGQVEAPDVASAKAAAAVQFDLDEVQRTRIRTGTHRCCPHFILLGRFNGGAT